jgi:hypothetical protein
MGFFLPEAGHHVLGGDALAILAHQQCARRDAPGAMCSLRTQGVRRVITMWWFEARHHAREGGGEGWRYQWGSIISFPHKMSQCNVVPNTREGASRRIITNIVPTVCRDRVQDEVAQAEDSQ